MYNINVIKLKIRILKNAYNVYIILYAISVIIIHIKKLCQLNEPLRGIIMFYIYITQ